MHKQFAGKDVQAIPHTIGGRPCVFARGAAASQMFYDTARQTDAVTTDAAPECVEARIS
jgi:hypothetical protein